MDFLCCLEAFVWACLHVESNPCIWCVCLLVIRSFISFHLFYILVRVFRFNMLMYWFHIFISKKAIWICFRFFFSMLNCCGAKNANTLANIVHNNMCKWKMCYISIVLFIKIGCSYGPQPESHFYSSFLLFTFGFAHNE